MTPFDSIVLGIVEGITEFLPISSTGHLILTSSLLHISQTDFAKSFEVVIQLGAILAVAVFYFRSFFNWVLIKKLVVAFIPTGIIGLALYHIIKTYLLGNDLVVLAALLLGGVALIVFEKFHTEAPEMLDLAALSYKQAFFVGLAQAVAVIPGVSRSAATIIGGLALGIPRKTIVAFSFLLAVPTMLAATALSLLKTSFAFSGNDIELLAIGFITSFVVALIAIRWFLKYIQNHSFAAFGWYRIVAALAFFFLFVR